MKWNSFIVTILVTCLYGADSFHLFRHASPRTSFQCAKTLSWEEKDNSINNRQATTQASSIPSMPLQQQLNRRRRRQVKKDVVIVGGGLSGLSTAMYLSQIDPDRHITILERNEHPEASNMASLAAAGMLAPHSERLAKGDYLDLCMASKNMFPEFAAMVESLAQEVGPEGATFLSPPREDMEPWNIGYVATGGFLAPAFAGDNVATWAPPEYDDSKASAATWLDATQVRELEPHLHPDVVGGWWFPEDSSVDAQRLTRSLKAACVGLGVEFLCGQQYEVTSLDLQDGKCLGIWLKSGKYMATKSLLVANGAWMRNLLPVPLEPHKGQSLSLRMPKDRPPILRRVLFAQDSYIVPKADGRIVIGATVEAGSFDGQVTPAGIMHILSHALQLVPGLANLPLDETWAGLRPTTPDKGPILGETKWENLFLAGGNWRNGVLLAPKTGQLLASLITEKKFKNEPSSEPISFLSEEDNLFLKAFAWDRFTSPEGAKRLAANTRYAASMYPVHTRRSGVGVAAAVGTELGSYSTARSASDERKKDRDSLFGSLGSVDSLGGGGADDSATEAAFERAAQLGLQDASAFDGFPKTYNNNNKAKTANADTTTALSWEPPDSSASTTPYDGSADAFTVGHEPVIETEMSEPEINSSDTFKGDKNGSNADLQSIYQSILKNKSKQKVDLPEKADDERPDPGYRIYHIDKETGERREVPPYTSPGEFLSSIKRSKEENVTDSTPKSADMTVSPGKRLTAKSAEYDETTYDGYQAILDANGSNNREDELKAMKEARRKNRLGQSDVNY
jgi:thiazole synthase